MRGNWEWYAMEQTEMHKILKIEDEVLGETISNCFITQDNAYSDIGKYVKSLLCDLETDDEVKLVNSFICMLTGLTLRSISDECEKREV